MSRKRNLNVSQIRNILNVDSDSDDDGLSLPDVDDDDAVIQEVTFDEEGIEVGRVNPQSPASRYVFLNSCSGTVSESGTCKCQTLKSS